MPTIVCTQCGRSNDASALRCAECFSALPADETRIDDPGARARESKRLQYELFQANERAEAAEAALQQATRGRVWGWIGVLAALAGMAGAFLGGLWLGRGGLTETGADARAVAVLRAQIAEQARKIDELRSAATNASTAAPGAKEADKAPAPAERASEAASAPPSRPDATAPPAAADGRPAPVGPVPAVPAPSAAPRAPASAAPPEVTDPRSASRTVARAAREGTLTWEGDLRDLVAMANDKPLTIRIEGAEATTDPDTRAGRLEGELPGVPVSIESVDPGVVVVEAPDASNRWKRIVLRVDARGGGERRSLHLKASVRWVVS